MIPLEKFVLDSVYNVVTVRNLISSCQGERGLLQNVYWTRTIQR